MSIKLDRALFLILAFSMDVPTSLNGTNGIGTSFTCLMDRDGVKSNKKSNIVPVLVNKTIQTIVKVFQI